MTRRITGYHAGVYLYILATYYFEDRRRLRESDMSADSTPVKVYVYDLSNGLARQLSLQLTGKQIDGIWLVS